MPDEFDWRQTEKRKVLERIHDTKITDQVAPTENISQREMYAAWRLRSKPNTAGIPHGLYQKPTEVASCLRNLFWYTLNPCICVPRNRKRTQRVWKSLCFSTNTRKIKNSFGEMLHIYLRNNDIPLVSIENSISRLCERWQWMDCVQGSGKELTARYSADKAAISTNKRME